MDRITDIKKLLENWYVSYNQYSDQFQIYDDMVLKLPKGEIKEKRNRNIRILINKNSSLPVLLEIQHAYDTLGWNIDNMNKSDIISLVKPYLQKYA